MEVYGVIRKLEPSPEALMPGSVWTAELVEEAFAGKGVGRKTVGQIIREHDLDGRTVLQHRKFCLTAKTKHGTVCAFVYEKE